MTSEKETIPKVVQDLVAGTVGGWSQVIVGQPLDTIKVRIQTQPSPPIYKNAMDCTQQLVRQEGVKGLYRGVMPPLAGIGFCNAIMFMSNGFFRRMLQKGNETGLSIAQVGMAGSMAGSVMAFLNCPIELLKVKLQTRDPKGVIGVNGKLEPPFKGVIDCGIRSIRAQGFLGIYRGMGMTLLRDVPGYFAYFFCYETSKKLLQSQRKDNQLSTLDLLTAGGLSGLAAWIPSYPQDVIKSCYQNDLRYASYGQVFKDILRTKGPKAFFHGIGPAMARAFPANAATFFAYEMTMTALKSSS
ncbi:mitochondrial carrier domain-containing protein [Gilbertella persicaria]|uniref:mitochondrial carrier domain-containing protein n=1 Tax=Gilbertella persicaria TaxID=101096 RepID=UPI0022209A37|nr:mitochondrial carrier domain-containing protein [Gilbertella persicaria]KAI8070654.1 mitochondrial carrier domain-containing protein [Gilbertella persicaria]